MAQARRHSFYKVCSGRFVFVTELTDPNKDEDGWVEGVEEWKALRSTVRADVESST
jgi:hypothetical protein